MDASKPPEINPAFISAPGHRWFIRQAVAGLERGGVGYTMWTIANVVGHKAEDGSLEGVALPLGMTMGRYPGIASRAAMRACVDAVKLPTASGS